VPRDPQGVFLNPKGLGLAGFDKLVAAHAHKAYQPGWIAHNQTVRHDVFGHYCTGAYQGKPSHGDAAV